MRNIRILPTILFLIFSLQLSAQFVPDRYINEVFTLVSETTDVKFSSNVPQPNPGGGFYESVTGYPVNVEEYNTSNINLYMDVMEPTGDTRTKRPLVVICFGGGFVAGSRDYWSMRLIGQGLAKRGYVVALIDYRLGMNMFDSGLAERAVYRGFQDGRSAVRYFKADAAGANNFKVDVDNIYIGGHSAGSFIGIHNAYLDKEIERPVSTFYGYIQWSGFFGTTANYLPDLGCLDCVGDNQSYSGNAKAIFSLAGAIGDVNLMESASDPSGVFFHSQDDGTVPYDSGEPFDDVSYLVVGSDLPVVYGSLPITNRANTLGIPNQFYSYTSRGHGVHENGSSALYSEIVPNISSWFYNHLLKPDAHSISGIATVGKCDLTQTYSTETGLAEEFDWQIIGGTIITSSITSNTVTVDWDENATMWSISVRPYKCNGAAGDLVSFPVTIVDKITNTWISSSGDWSDGANWSLGRAPKICDDVVIPIQVASIAIDIPASNVSEVRSLMVDQNATLTQNIGAVLNVVGGGNMVVNGILNVHGSIIIHSITDVINAEVVCQGNIVVEENGSIDIAD